MTSTSLTMNVTTKILLVVFVALVVYLVSILLMSFLLAPQTGGSSMQDTMGQMMGFSSTGGAYLNGVFAVTLGVGAGLVTALLLGAFSTTQRIPYVPPPPPVQPTSTQNSVSETDKFKIIRSVLSDDEKAVVDEIRRAGKITQDSLRFRLNWSKAKVSRILTSLDKMNLVQRERVGKTYNVFLTEHKNNN